MSEEIKQRITEEKDATRGLFVFDTVKQKLVPVTRYKKAPIELPSVITDEIPPTLSHATKEGRVFTSKAKLRQHYRENGCIEVGKWTPSKYKPVEVDEAAIRDAAEKAYYDIKYDRIPIDEKEKAICLEEERRFKVHKKRLGY